MVGSLRYGVCTLIHLKEINNDGICRRRKQLMDSLKCPATIIALMETIVMFVIAPNAANEEKEIVTTKIDNQE